MVDTQHFESVLKKRLQDLDDRLHEIESELDEPVPADSEERATEREDDEVLEELGNAGLKEIQMIRVALDRIAKGTYGICVSCEEPISNERLEAVPHAARCHKCA